MLRMAYEDFVRAVRPVLEDMDRSGRTLESLEDEAERAPRVLTPAEYLLVLASHCRKVRSRREKNYE